MNTYPLFLYFKVCACARVHLHVSAGHLYSGLQALSPSAALIRALIKSCVNWCWGQHWPPRSLRTSIQLSFCIPLNGERSSIINLLYAGDKSSVKERDREKQSQIQKERKREPFLHWSSWSMFKGEGSTVIDYSKLKKDQWRGEKLFH